MAEAWSGESHAAHSHKQGSVKACVPGAQLDYSYTASQIVSPTFRMGLPTSTALKKTSHKHSQKPTLSRQFLIKILFKLTIITMNNDVIASLLSHYRCCDRRSTVPTWTHTFLSFFPFLVGSYNSFHFYPRVLGFQIGLTDVWVSLDYLPRRKWLVIKHNPLNFQ